jgi:hypothetical protein
MSIHLPPGGRNRAGAFDHGQTKPWRTKMHLMDALLACNVRPTAAVEIDQPMTPAAGRILKRLAVCLGIIVVLAGAVHAATFGDTGGVHLAAR